MSNQQKNKLLILWTSICISVILVMVFSKATCAQPTPAPESIKLGGVLPITGKAAALGAQVKAGFEIAVKGVNAAGGIYVAQYGKKLPVELLILDDESDPVKSANKLETLYAVHKVTAYLVLGEFGVEGAIGHKNKVPTMMATAPVQSFFEKGYKYMFSPFYKSNDIADETVGLFDSIPEGERPTKVAILYVMDEFGEETAKKWREKVLGRGYEVVSYAKYSLEAKDFTSYIIEAKSAGADAVLNLTTPPQAMAYQKQTKALDFSPKFTNMTRGPITPIWQQVMGADGDYVTANTGWFHTLPFPNIDYLNAEYRKLRGLEAEPVSGPAYACVQILANAIGRAGSLDRDMVTQAIFATNMITVTGPITFRPNGTVPGITCVTSQFQGKKSHVVWPLKYRTKEFLPTPPWSKR